jgi:hypothetical protein
MRLHRRLLTNFPLAILAACSNAPPEVTFDPHPSTGGSAGTAGVGAAGTAGTLDGGSSGIAGTGGSGNGGSAGSVVIDPDAGTCARKTCAELGWACGYTIDECGSPIDCAVEGLTCAADQICVGGIDSPTQCMVNGAATCPVCSGIPDCTAAATPTRLVGRVVTPGRDDANVDNQIGVPNAIVYILRTNAATDLPAITTGIPEGGTACDRCEDQDLGPVLTGAITDATGTFVLEGNIPVGVEILLVIKAGRFRRAINYTIPAEAGCQETGLPTTLPENPARLPRTMADGLAVNIPRIAVSTGEIDAMECVLEKMGLASTEFTNPGATGDGTGRVHLYVGGPNEGTPVGRGARLDADTPHNSLLYSDPARLASYDLVVADCEGGAWDQGFTERDASGANVREFVNRGGRMFASHLSFSWLHENGMDPYTADMPLLTGLGPAGTWDSMITFVNTGTGLISVGRPAASPRIQNFADWMENEGIALAPMYDFEILEPRSQNTAIGPSSEEFVYMSAGQARVQQFSFNTPYAAPPEAACGRVAYSGFHVSVGSDSENRTDPFADVTFPTHCAGNLTDQEKVLLYMLFDLGACVGDDPPPPPCVPETCDSVGAACGFTPDGCGAAIDCGPCEPPR